MTGDHDRELDLLSEKVVRARRKRPPEGFPQIEDDSANDWAIYFGLMRDVCGLFAIVASFLSPPWVIVVLFVCSGIYHVIYHRLQTPWEKAQRKLYKWGIPVRGALMQANAAAFDPENDKTLPGTAVISFDPQLGRDPERLQQLGEDLISLKYADRSTMDPEIAAIAWDLRHEMGPMPRRLVPESVCEATETYIEDLQFPPGSISAQQPRYFLSLRDWDGVGGTMLLPASMTHPVTGTSLS